MSDVRSDAELLRSLRGGDSGAYAVLWSRHVGAAYRLAERLYPSRAEDLVSESFLAVYQQVTMTSKGPQFAFRSYLKTVMRNTAMRWSKDASQVVDAVDVEQVDHRDALSVVETEANASDLLAAFQELPERWQQVLWLAEVAEVGRPQIADELGIKPNAVSALQRRARAGLKLNWLTRQIPPALREDDDHVARLLPSYLTTPADEVLAAEVSAHVATCAVCSDLLHGMRTASVQLQRTTLAAAGFGALGTAVPAAASLSSGSAVATFALADGSAAGLGVATSAVATSAVTTGVVATGLVAGLSALTISGLILASSPAEVGAAPPSRSQITIEVPGQVVDKLLPTHAPAIIDTDVPGIVDPTLTVPTLPQLGRWNTDPAIDVIDLVSDPAFELRTTPPGRAPVVAPTPVPGTGLGIAAPVLSTPTTHSGYLAPVLAGTTTSGSAVAVDFDDRQYTVTPAEDGTWSFDLRAIEPAEGPHRYTVWAFNETAQSPQATGTFTILPITVEGFENLTGFEDMRVEEASTTGVVIAVTGPANGTIFVTTMGGHSALIPLDATGYAVKRLRMHSRGWYAFTFRALDTDGYWGPPVENYLDVYDPDIIFDPWGPTPDEMTFDVADL